MLAADLKDFDGSVYEERWGTVAHCILKLLPLEPALRSRWSLEAYTTGTTDYTQLKRDDKHGSRLDLVDEAIGSPFWWAYMRMLASFASLFKRLLGWAEGCSCHGDLPYDNVPKCLQDFWLTCPMGGRRGAEIFGGDFK